jgi:hypothetical protein
MTKTLLAAPLAALLLGGCAARDPLATGENMNGFPVDEKCMEYHASSPMYGGNRALAYATDCAKIK